MERTPQDGLADRPVQVSIGRVPQRSVLADEVYRILRENLIARRIEPGARLNLDQLARDLHVSNTPVRQALARLESDGLVTKEPYRGFAASPLLDSRAIAELYDYRLMIEPPTAARVARRPRPEVVAELDGLCDGESIQALIDEGAEDALGDRDIAFHCAIAREAGNTVVLDSLAAALTRMRLYTVYHRHGAASQAWDEHRSVLESIRAGDPEAAALAMRAHLTCGLDRLRGVIAS